DAEQRLGLNDRQSPSGSDFLRDDKRRAIATPAVSKKTIGLFVADHLSAVRIDLQPPPEAIRSVRQMHQRAGDVSVLDGGPQVLPLPAAHAVDEIHEMIVAGMPSRPGPLIAARPALVAERIFVAGGKVSVRSVEDVADGVAPIQQAAPDSGF